MVNRIAVSLLVLGVAACSNDDEATAPEDHGGKLTPPGGGGTAVATLRQGSLLAGTTNAGVRATAVFGAESLSEADVERATTALVGRASFVGVQGGAVPASVKVDLVPHDLTSGASYVFNVSPLSDLALDAWYILRILPGYPEITPTQETERTGYVAGRELRVPFFTGSAPAVDILVANKDGSVGVYMSEPVRLGSVVSAVKFVGADGEWAGCESYLNSCLTPDTGIINGAFNYRFDVARDVRAQLVSVDIGGNVAGGGRTVAEASRAGLVGASAGMQLAGEESWRQGRAFRPLPIQ